MRVANAKEGIFPETSLLEPKQLTEKLNKSAFNEQIVVFYSRQQAGIQTVCIVAKNLIL